MLETQAEILVTYAKTLNGEHITPSDMSQFLNSFAEHGRKNLSALSSVSEEIVEIDHQIYLENAQLTAKKGSSSGNVSVVIGTDEDGTVELKLTYSVWFSFSCHLNKLISFTLQLWPTRLGNQLMSSMPRQRMASLFLAFPSTTVHGSVRAQAKIGRIQL